MHLSDLLRTRVLRYTAVAVMAFSAGSASIVLAASSGAMQLPVFRLADGTNPDQFAKVDAAGNVQVSVNNQPSTQQISGNVSVNNFPATQNVTGAVTTTPSVASKAIIRSFSFDAGESGQSSFNQVNASYILAWAHFGDIRVRISGPLGQVWVMDLGDNENRPLFFTQRIPVTLITAECLNVVLNCGATVHIYGD